LARELRLALIGLLTRIRLVAARPRLPLVRGLAPGPRVGPGGGVGPPSPAGFGTPAGSGRAADSGTPADSGSPADPAGAGLRVGLVPGRPPARREPARATKAAGPGRPAGWPTATATAGWATMAAGPGWAPAMPAWATATAGRQGKPDPDPGAVPAHLSRRNSTAVAGSFTSSPKTARNDRVAPEDAFGVVREHGTTNPAYTPEKAALEDQAAAARNELPQRP